MNNTSIFKRFISTAGLQLLGRGLSVTAGVLFARLLGPEEYGRYSFALSIVSVLMLPIIAGLPNLIIREVSRYFSCNDFKKLFGFIRWALIYVVIMSFVSISILTVLTYLNVWDDYIAVLLLSCSLLLPIRGLLSRQGAILNGLQRPELAQLPPLILSPIIVLIIITILHLNNVDIDAKSLIYIQTISTFFALFIGFFILKSVLNKLDIYVSSISYNIKVWHRALLPFTLLAIVGTMNNEIATMMLGFLGNEVSVGYFKVSVQGISLLALGLQSVNTVSGPKIASLYKQGKLKETQELLYKSVYFSVLTTVPLALVLIFYGDVLISFLFGSEYMPASKLLTILCVGQIFNICMGSVGLVLNMTGNEKATIKAQIITLILTLLLLLILIPLYQDVGAAIAVTLGLVIWNIIMAFDVYRLTRLKTWICL